MRHSTPGEQAIYERMLASMSEGLVTKSRFDALEDENAKMRWLLADMYGAFKELDGGCYLHGEDTVCPFSCMPSECCIRFYYDELRKLGIEVEDGDCR